MLELEPTKMELQHGWLEVNHWESALLLLSESDSENGEAEW